MDPITLIVGAGALIVGAVIGFATTRAPSKLRDENTKLKKDLRQVTLERDNSDMRLRYMKSDLQCAQESRDKYRAIASTHEVKYPEPPKPVQLRKVWKERGYRGLPEANLKALADDIQQYEGQELHLDLVLRGRGGWKNIIGESWHHIKRINGYNKRVPADYIGTTRFRGSVKQVLAEIEVFLRDDDTGLVVKGGPNRGQWRDKDSALKFEIDLSVKGAVKPPPMPEVHTVEVAVVEERIVERIVEKPVFLTEGEDGGPALCGHTKEEIVGLIDAVIEARSTSPSAVELSDQIVEAAQAHEESPA